ncbi:small acid-soluble spore protein SspI [Jeotgalibacillus soli]|uniref:Small, acid-soluble spore protein I n=1 Tax=Jeotgalibacillus soli TaxID=889306 RepID=A0A0C2R0D7_9BACL|nr:small acid-soluble spore protein SspI [Jeotgalibacillus soli]KIL43790.1 spore protein [Jeotgalibacillus soli]
MNLNIRGTVIQNVKENTPAQLEATIEDAIEGKEETLLPGLGVLFEMIWQKSSREDRDQMIKTLESGLTTA